MIPQKYLLEGSRRVQAPTTELSEGTNTQIKMILPTAHACILHFGDNSPANAIVVYATAFVGDFDDAVAIDLTSPDGR